MRQPMSSEVNYLLQNLCKWFGKNPMGRGVSSLSSDRLYITSLNTCRLWQVSF